MKITYESFAGIGGRNFMQDAIAVRASDDRPRISAVICDGHGDRGEQAARRACGWLDAALQTFNRIGVNSHGWTKGHVLNAFSIVDMEIHETFGPMVGVAATMLCIEDDVLAVANAGDAEVWIWRGKELIQCSSVHRLSNEKENRRVTRAGAQIFRDRLVSGDIGLQLTRSIGDHMFDRAGHICTPEITVIPLRRHDMVIAATDGLWDCITPGEILKAPKGIRQCVRYLKRHCGRSARDNFAVTVFKAL